MRCHGVTCLCSSGMLGHARSGVCMPCQGRKRQAELEEDGGHNGASVQGNPNGQHTRNIHGRGGETSALTCIIHPGGAVPSTVSHLPLTLLERLRVCILNPATWDGGNVRLGKILAFKQQRLARCFAQRVRKTVAKVEPGPMAP